jgi:hypothetical protein
MTDVLNGLEAERTSLHFCQFSAQLLHVLTVLKMILVDPGPVGQGGQLAGEGGPRQQLALAVPSLILGRFPGQKWVETSSGKC